ncbi:MAG TPA: zf-TFIIB domain-containing protein [Candidatus Saccharimonadales bacterium]|nr:zf-TFIIB domain-containing protein [Candidatus Saccharimonadales bacterium]
MQCPVDGTTLVMSDRQGIEIDYCPQCRGVWLDRGEIDKIVERSMGGPAPAAAPVQHQPQQPYPQQTHSSHPAQSHQEYRHHDDDDDHYRNQHGGHHKRKENWLGDLFD